MYSTEYSRVISLWQQTAYKFFPNMVSEQLIFCCIQEQVCYLNYSLSIVQHSLLIAHWSDGLPWMSISPLRVSEPWTAVLQIPHTVGLLSGKWESERERDSRWVFSLQSSEKWSITNCCAQIAEPSTRAVMCTYFGDRLERNTPKALKATFYDIRLFSTDTMLP